jgi:hypothetical protein
MGLNILRVMHATEDIAKKQEVARAK